ncbi:MAG: hypothetical protein CMF39_00330, partial [Legionellaceae bacterium]|nr:hypothetical protein [Legionellaceae bacterium]
RKSASFFPLNARDRSRGQAFKRSMECAALKGIQALIILNWIPDQVGDDNEDLFLDPRSGRG